ncbi:uncharacterized protein LOC132785621 isoform X1 [Drosophila nasuta]|uniref:uncharacterized protein LOC132785621 isoform X1 n=2 Tax=Drosophila nasuta TaxID=42062 RepID=UPI00295E33AF|nr:uncharacterized protein LOC132785621 isoform X1 [Drosophila nasuta]
MKLNFKLNLMIFCSWWVIISNCLAVCEIGAYCLREMPRAVEASSGSRTRHMWQPRHPTSLVAPADAAAAETGSCNRPTTLRPATDSNVAASQQLNGIGNATIQAAAAAAMTTAASPAVTLANYVYQCAAKRASSSSNSCASNSNDNISQLEQQLTVFQSHLSGFQEFFGVDSMVKINWHKANRSKNPTS